MSEEKKSKEQIAEAITSDLNFAVSFLNLVRSDADVFQVLVERVYASYEAQYDRDNLVEEENGKA